MAPAVWDVEKVYRIGSAWESQGLEFLKVSGLHLLRQQDAGQTKAAQWPSD